MTVSNRKYISGCFQKISVFSFQQCDYNISGCGLSSLSGLTFTELLKSVGFCLSPNWESFQAILFGFVLFFSLIFSHFLWCSDYPQVPEVCSLFSIFSLCCPDQITSIDLFSCSNSLSCCLYSAIKAIQQCFDFVFVLVFSLNFHFSVFLEGERVVFFLSFLIFC